MSGTALRYRWPAKLLHWLTAAAILTVVPLGFAMTSAAPGPTQNRLFDLHRSFGVLVLALTAARLLWRLYSPAPPLVAGMPRWQWWIAKISHIALYVLLFAVPLVGWVATSAYGAPMSVFGLFQMPMILAQDRELSKDLFEVHEALALLLCNLLVLHIGAALHHHFVRKDDTLRRML